MLSKCLLEERKEGGGQGEKEGGREERRKKGEKSESRVSRAKRRHDPSP